VIPYRESKLTQALRDFFIGQAKGRMIINISLAEQDFEETLHVLDFANTAKEVSTNMRRADRRPGMPATPFLARPAPAQVEPEARAMIDELTRRVEQLQEQLEKQELEIINKEMEVRGECVTAMAERLHEMELINHENVEKARAFAEEKYEKKIQILSQYIQWAPQQHSGKASLDELAAHMDAEHWKRQHKEVTPPSIFPRAHPSQLATKFCRP